MNDTIVAVLSVAASVAVLVPYYTRKLVRLRRRNKHLYASRASILDQYYKLAWSTIDTRFALETAQDFALDVYEENCRLRLQARADESELSKTEQALMSHVIDRLDASAFEHTTNIEFDASPLPEEWHNFDTSDNFEVPASDLDPRFKDTGVPYLSVVVVDHVTEIESFDTDSLPFWACGIKNGEPVPFPSCGD